jgi:hypothetical protein
MPSMRCHGPRYWIACDSNWQNEKKSLIQQGAREKGRDWEKKKKT